MSIRKVTSSLNDPTYVRALETEIGELRVIVMSTLTRTSALEKRPRAANNKAAVPMAPVGLACAGSSAGTTATFRPVTLSTTGEPIEIALHELVGALAVDEAPTWTPLPGAGPDSNFLQVSDDGQTILNMDGYTFRRSDDGGATWTGTTFLEYGGVGRIAAAADCSIVAIEVYGGVLVSHDGGGSWVIRENPGASPSCLTMSRDGQAILYAVNDGSGGPLVLHRSADSGASWSAQSTSFFGEVTDIAFIGDGNVAFMNGDYTGRLHWSADRGASWALLPHDFGVADTITSTSTASGLAYAACRRFDGVLVNALVSADNGQSWTSIPVASGRIVASHDGSLLVAASVNGTTEAGFSTDGGQTWTLGGIQSIYSFDVSADGNLVVAHSDGPGVSSLSRTGGGGGAAGNEASLGFTIGTSGSIATGALAPGEWTFRVRAISTRGAVGAFSQPFTLTIA